MQDFTRDMQTFSNTMHALDKTMRTLSSRTQSMSEEQAIHIAKALSLAQATTYIAGVTYMSTSVLTDGSYRASHQEREMRAARASVRALAAREAREMRAARASVLALAAREARNSNASRMHTAAPRFVEEEFEEDFEDLNLRDAVIPTEREIDDAQHVLSGHEVIKAGVPCVPSLSAIRC